MLMSNRWEVWRACNGIYWMERPIGRQEVADLQRCVASFSADSREAALSVMRLFVGGGR